MARAAPVTSLLLFALSVVGCQARRRPGEADKTAPEVPGPPSEARDSTTPGLVKEFQSADYFWRQAEVAKKIVERGDDTAIESLQSYLDHDDRHIRCNAALVLAGLGDDRGIDAISGVLRDRSDRPAGQGIAGGNWTVQAQIRADRYYAVHVLGALKKPEAVPVLLPLLEDDEVAYKVAWALGEIGDARAVAPLIRALGHTHPNVRVIAADSLAKLRARSALPRLRSLMNDNEKASFGEQMSVADAARAAIASLEQNP